MSPTGRERRRTDVYGRARRMMYGLLLAAAAPGAHAADEFALLGQYAATIREGLRVELSTSAGPMHLKLSHSPEVRLDLDEGGGLVPSETAIRYGKPGELPGEKVPQLTARWRF